MGVALVIQFLQGLAGIVVVVRGGPPGIAFVGVLAIVLAALAAMDEAWARVASGLLQGWFAVGGLIFLASDAEYPVGTWQVWVQIGLACLAGVIWIGPLLRARADA